MVNCFNIKFGPIQNNTGITAFCLNITITLSHVLSFGCFDLRGNNTV